MKQIIFNAKNHSNKMFVSVWLVIVFFRDSRLISLKRTIIPDYITYFYVFNVRNAEFCILFTHLENEDTHMSNEPANAEYASVVKPKSKKVHYKGKSLLNILF